MLDTLRDDGITLLEAMLSLAVIGILLAAHTRGLYSALLSIQSMQTTLHESAEPPPRTCRTVPLNYTTEHLLLCETQDLKGRYAGITSALPTPE